MLELLVRLARRDRQVLSARQAQQDHRELQAIRVLRERQVQRDLKELQEARERLDRQDQLVLQDRKA